MNIYREFSFLAIVLTTFAFGTTDIFDNTRLVGPDIKLMLIEGGTFMMGSEVEADEKPVHSVTVESFWMGQTEVTNAQYATFLNQAMPAEDDRKTWVMINAESKFSHIFFYAHKYYVDARWEDHPITNVSWSGARKFCEYYGLRLPTEAEWEYCAGGYDHTRYPWGYDYMDGMSCSIRNQSYGDPPTAVVASYPPNDYDLYDMAGNVWEWCQDWYDALYYSDSIKDNPFGPNSGRMKVIKGGSWLDDEMALRCAKRSDAAPDSCQGYIGFRCCAACIP